LLYQRKWARFHSLQKPRQFDGDNPNNGIREYIRNFMSKVKGISENCIGVKINIRMLPTWNFLGK